MKPFTYRFLPYSALLFMLCSMPLGAQDERYDHPIKDLAYGTSLYHYFQGKQLDAIVDIKVAKQRNSLQNESENAELLLGGLYFEYGLTNEAEGIFQNLLDETISTSTRNKVWFNLARVLYEKTQYSQTEQLLSRISDRLPAQHEAEKQHILTNLYLHNKQYDKAAEATRQIKPESIWLAYSQYNLGLSLTAAENKRQGREWLKRLSGRQIPVSKTEDEELVSLLDSTRLALGLDSLKRNQPEEAIRHLSKIRISGPLSNKALLATGWAWSHKSDPDKALTYWLALRDKQQTDAATQEVLLAIAHAFEQKNNKALATQFYQQATVQYNHMLDETDTVIDRIHSDELLDALHSNRLVEDASRYTFELKPPQSVATPYLHHMFASKHFQQEIQQYQELLDIKASLSQWMQNLPAFKLMLKERRQSFEFKKPLVEQSTGVEQLEKLQQQRDKFADEVNRIETSEDFKALANEDETNYLLQLETVEATISNINDQRELSEEQDKYRLLSGLLHWQLSIDFPRRIWFVKREIQLLDRALLQAMDSAQSLRQASSINDLKLNEFDQRIEGRDAEINSLYDEVNKLIDLHEKQINKLAIEAITSRKQNLTQLRLSARYSIARLYDEIYSDKGTQQ